MGGVPLPALVSGTPDGGNQTKNMLSEEGCLPEMKKMEKESVNQFMRDLIMDR